MVHKKPKVSVIMPAYNAARYIEEAIHSVQAQTMEDWELLVIDDCSTDDTCAVVEAMAEQDQRIQLIRKEQNSGPATSRNLGFQLCQGDYAALLDSDDIWYPEKLEKQLALARQKKADIVYCSYAMVDTHGDKLCNDFIVPERTDLKSMLVKSVISCSTAMLSRNVVEKYRFPTDYYHEDYALWLQLMKDYDAAYGTAEVLADYRISADSRAANKLSSASRRWVIYRSFMKMSWLESAWYLAQYALAALIKYHKV